MKKRIPLQTVKRSGKPSSVPAPDDATRPLEPHELETRSKKSKQRQEIHNYKTGETIPVSPVPVDYIAAGLDEDFKALVLRHQVLHNKIQALEAKKKDKAAQILTLVQLVGYKTVTVDDRFLATQAEGQKRLKKELLKKHLLKLLPAKVVGAVIDQSSPKGNPYIVVSDKQKTAERAAEKKAEKESK